MIYADFRVRGRRAEDGHERVEIFSLAEAYALIFSKLADMTEEKQLRYRTVYAKLYDFEQYLISNGADPDPIQTGTCVAQKCDAALAAPVCDSPPAVQFDILHNIRRMRRIMHDASFEQLLEQARNEQIAEYSHLSASVFGVPHLSHPGAEGQLLAFLYELLMHHDGDVRPPGSPDYGSDSQQQRPQIPQGTAGRRRGSGQCAESAVLPQRIAAGLGSVCRGLPAPGSENYAKHALRISNSLTIIAESVFQSLSRDKWPEHLQVLHEQARKAIPEDRLS